jgi:hypothetical protein
MRFHDAPPPRSRKRIRNAFEKSPMFNQVTRALLQGNSCAVSFAADDAKALGVKWPQRMAIDSIKRWLRENHMEEAFVVRKYRSEDSWVVSAVPARHPRRKRDEQVPAAKSA